jgi:hypothetical protein
MVMPWFWKRFADEEKENAILSFFEEEERFGIPQRCITGAITK